ncbi:hypothetical protein Lal_00011248 [Lupinus albus]|nr:hypothetical protein Lal_00011248 [Lupinus albus]
MDASISINLLSSTENFSQEVLGDALGEGMSSRSLEDVANKDSQRSKANEDVSISDTPLGARGSSRGNNI